MGIQAQDLFKTLGDPPQDILKSINCEIKDGEYVALTGRSGSGKSTLLYVLSLLDSASRGKIFIDGMNSTDLTQDELHEFRNRKMGFIFQFHYLLPELNALENVLMPCFKYGEQIHRKNRARDLLELVGLKDRMHSLPRQMSGGEQQRVAIARSLIMEPRYLFSDEPTGALDTVNADIVISLLEKSNREHKTTVVLVTHDPDFATRAKRQIVLSDGKIIKDFTQS